MRKRYFLFYIITITVYRKYINNKTIQKYLKYLKIMQIEILKIL